MARVVEQRRGLLRGAGEENFLIERMTSDRKLVTWEVLASVRCKMRQSEPPRTLGIGLR